MSLQKIRQGIVTTLENLATKPVARFYENQDAKPGVHKLWSKFSFMPNADTAATLGDSGEQEVTGVAQVSLFCPLGRGEAELQPHIDAMLLAFKAGTLIAHSGQIFTVISAQRGTGMESDNQWMVPFTIGFRGRFKRQAPTT